MFSTARAGWVATSVCWILGYTQEVFEKFHFWNSSGRKAKIFSLCSRGNYSGPLARSSLCAHPRTMPEQHALTHFPENPDDELKWLRERVAEQTAIIEGQTATIEQMPERIQEFEARPAKDRHNSSPPLASDSPFTKPPLRSRCQSSGHKPGGQPEQPSRTQPAHAQAQAESLWLLPLRYRHRGLCHPPLLPLNSPQTIRHSFNSLVLTVQGQPPMPPLE